MVNFALFVVLVLVDTSLLRDDASNVPYSLILVHCFSTVYEDLDIDFIFCTRNLLRQIFGLNSHHYEHVLDKEVYGIFRILLEIFNMIYELDLSVKIEAVFDAGLIIRV